MKLLLTLITTLIYVPTLVAQELPKANMDIAGIKLGMTESEVVNAIKKFDSKAQVRQKTTANYSYFDGVNSLQTPDFLDIVSLQINDGFISVHFTSPPSQPRVYAVIRKSTNKNPPTSQQFESALDTKYGKPGMKAPPRSGYNISQWNESGRPTCQVTKDRTGKLVPEQQTGFLYPPSAVKNLEVAQKQSHPNLALSMGKKIDVASCGAVLRYQWSSDSVSNFEAFLIDQGDMVNMNRQTAEWVKNLEAESVNKRKSQGSTPKL